MSLARPLLWRKSQGHPQDGDRGSWVADGIAGRYHAEKERDGTWLLWWAHDNFIWEACSDFSDVKAKAEADWQRRFSDQIATPERGPSINDGGFLGPVLTTRIQEALARPRDSDGNPEGGDATAPSRSDDSAGRESGIAHTPEVS